MKQPRWAVEAASKFIESLSEFCQGFDDGHVTSTGFEELCKGVKAAVSSGAQRALQVYLEDHDDSSPELLVDGQKYWTKGKSRREVLTPFGKVVFDRNVYQGSAGGATVAPLDIRCGIADEYGTPDVREAAVLLSSNMVYQECVDVLDKVSLISLSLRGLENMVHRTGEFVERHRNQFVNRVSSQLDVPEGTRVLVASMDGVNVRLDEPGEKRGRPGMRPGVSTGTQKTCHKNAMVGCFSLYGEAIDLEKCPPRLGAMYIARMPEDGAECFKQNFELALQNIEGSFGQKEIKKVLLMDGQRSLWTYA